MNILEDLKKELLLWGKSTASDQTAPVEFRGPGFAQIEQQRFIDYTSWDSLGITGQRTLLRGIHQELDRIGFGGSFARNSAGRPIQLEELEERFASFTGRKAAVVFPSRNQAILSLFTTLLNEQDTVVIAEDTVSPVSDAAFFVGARVVSFNRYRPTELSTTLKAFKGKSRRVIAFLEACHEFSGQQTDIEQISNTLFEAGVNYFLDESATLATTGLRGGGILDGVSLLHPPLGILADLSKTCNSTGAVLAAPQILIDVVKGFSTQLKREPAPPPLAAITARHSLDAIELAHSSRLALASRKEQFVSELQDLKVRFSSGGPIVSLWFSSNRKAKELADILYQRHILVETIPSTNVRSEEALVRFLISAHHSESDISKTLEQISIPLKRLLQEQ